MSEEITRYGSNLPMATTGASTEIAQARELAEVQGQIIMARQFPRNDRVAIDRILTACARPSLAEQAVYQYARGGTDITGPSIRLAEAIAQNWGNLQYGVREIEQRNGESTCEAFAWDMETNTRVSKSFKVPHLRGTKQGTKLLTDPRDIYEMVANQGARRVRACILSVVPGDIIEEAVKQCEATLRQHADVTPESIDKLVAAFAGLGVTKSQIEARIQRRIDSVTPALMANMRKIYLSIKDGMSTREEWFTAEEKPTSAGDEKPTKPAATTLKGRAKAKKPMEPSDDDEELMPY